jgi:toxin ParE1/3/4
LASRRAVEFTGLARRDLASILDHSRAAFGHAGQDRYEHLFVTALSDLAIEPHRAGSSARAELGTGVRSYHLRQSRDRARTASGVVRSPRHLVIYKLLSSERLLVLRILHDAMDLSRHIADLDFPDGDDRQS